MKYTADTKPGMGDPYWYEWSVGQKYIIDMLNPDNEIKHVELQADVALGLDDVVITYMDGHKKFVQVKHTRANDTLTFGDLVTIDTSNVDANSHISLLGELAKSWNEEHSKYSTTDILLFSNRKKGKRIAHAGPQRSIKRPALNWFIDDLSKQLETVKKYNELVFPGYELAWEEWKKQLEYIPNDDKKLEFLKHLSISTDQEELEALGETLIEKLKNTFKTNDEIARLLFVRLDHALRKWTTSIRDSSIVSVEDVLRELSIEDDIISYNHDLIPSVPFFESRLSVVEDIEKALSCPQNRVVFLSGIPGTGKTNIISKLSGKRNSIVNIRYYAYEPIDPQKEYLPKDVSRRVDNSVFWNELFNQLRRQLLGKLSKYRVPVINNLLPQEQLRSEFFRIAAEYAQDENSLFIVAIDGIDHAARANVSENTFLSALPNPEYLPENVKIVIAGQPKEDYRNYPEWLFNNEMGYVTAILEACESLHNKDALKESVVLEIMEHEFFKESSSIERNSLLEYLISFGKAEETDVLIRKYLGMLLQRDHYYCALDVPALVLWKMKQLSPEYGINGMKQILDMHRSWRTAAGHIKDVELTNEIIFTKLVDWNESTDLYTLFLDIALLLIKSEDADAARTALAGVFATLRVEPDYINFIEKMWDSFHYRAKEWILMIYELLWDYREDFHDNMLTILKKHCEDEDFNVSLYSNLLLENYSSDDSFKYIRNSKSYFDEIPNRGHKLFIKKNRPSPWINGYDCVMEQIELLSERLEVDGEHLEKRVADYCDKIPDTVQLIKLGRKWRGCRVVCENPNRSFLRVLYKDWYNHKFDWEEAELGRIVLSASEPYCLLITPQLWTYNNGYLLNPPESFISSSSVEQKKQIHDILFEGVDDTETVLAGGIIDYTHKEEIFGFMVSYFSIPGLPSKYAAYCYERNSRLLLQSRPDFSEQEHYNITLHHNGIESFQGSNIMCGFSKISLDEFHWHINITVNGMRLFNEGGQEIGRFEYYYGQRGNMGNRYISNQPLLQRWVVSKDAVSKARCIVGCPNNIKINHAFDSVIRKYED